MQQSPKVYATFLLWLLSELFERLPEIGDPEKPKLVFFFDEAHLLFADIEPPVQKKVEQMVRLIRSKGVGVYFVSQNPLDIRTLSLVSWAIASSTRACLYPARSKGSTGCRSNLPAKSETRYHHHLQQLAVGEALVSMLDENGTPGIVERAKIVPPRSQIGSITPEQRQQIINSSVLAGHYEKAVDRESAYEKLSARANNGTAGAPPEGGETAPATSGGFRGVLGEVTSIFKPTIGPPRRGK